MNKKLLILTGPQGAGNHMLSKIFASSAQIGGWKELLETYWLGHHTEPFFPIWTKARELEYNDFDSYQHWVTSISIPFVKNGELAIPDVLGFKQQAESLGIEATIGVIGRDINILKNQQSRVRGTPTLDLFLEEFAKFGYVTFLSHETLVLYGKPYMDRICDQIGFPYCDVPLMENANKKYIQYAESHDLDIEVHNATEESKGFKVD